MEKAFIATKESEYYKDFYKYRDKLKRQKEVVFKFFDEKGIKAERFHVGGDGAVNKPFGEWEKGNIKLEIEPTEKDLETFGKILCKENKHGLRSFRKNSNISKEFQQKCIDENIVINLYQPRVNDYFESLRHGLYGCTYTRLNREDKIYLQVSSEYLKDGDIPNGFKEIKLSEFYKALEEYEEQR